MRSQLLEIISECDGLDHYTETHQNFALDRMLSDLQRIDNLDRVHAMNISNRISNRDREAARRLVSMSRTPPKPNPHDPYESTMDALTDCVQGGQGREAKDLPGIGAGALFWVGLMAGAWLLAAVLAWYGPTIFAH